METVRHNTIFKGVATALVTPFKDGSIDFLSLRNLIEFNISGGVDALVVAGTTGEAPTLSPGELSELVGFTVNQTAGRIPVIAGVGSNCTSRSVAAAEYAGGICDGLLAVAPYYNKPNAEGLYEHFLSIAKSTVKPIIIYNVPSRTGIDIPFEVYSKLADVSNVTAIKEASGNLTNSLRILSEFGNRFDVYSGCDELTLPLLSVGGKGVISVLSNILPKAVSSLCKAWFSGDSDTAKDIHLRTLPLVRALFSETNPIPVKALLADMGLCLPEWRLPLCNPSGITLNSLKKAALPWGIFPL